MPPIETITVEEFREAGGTNDWPVLGEGAVAFFSTESLDASSELVRAIAELEGIEHHAPDIDIRSDGVTVRLVTATEGWFGMSRLDVELARLISATAAGLGLTARPSNAQSVGPIVIGAVDIKKVMPFWQALLDYVPRPDSPDEDLIDPRGRGPGIWFEQVEEAGVRPPRMHVAVWVPYDQAEGRVAAALAAGGTMVYDKRAPAWWTLADPEGHEGDVSTTMARD
jgi:4a-hydroxytetrahydrobiopterin dehydratase